MKKSVALLVTIFLFMCFWGSFGFCAANPPEPDQVELQADYEGLPLAFIKNQGQVDEKVLYYLKGREGTIYFTKYGIVYDLVKKDVGAQQAAPNNQEPEDPNSPESSIEDQKFSRLSFTLRPQGANPQFQVIPQDELPGKINYFIGNDSAKWHTNIPIYKSVIYQDLYPGIDLKVYGTNQQMEYDFIVHPGADPNKISLAGEGIDGLGVDAEGNLIIKTALTDIKHLKPIIYQEVDGKRLIVEGSFTAVQNRIGFDIKNYNKDYPLTIDPLTLSYSTFLGGGGDDYGRGIAVDNQGCAYITGYTTSSNFPTANAYDSSYNTNTDVFIAKFTASGTALSYATYLGGSNLDYGYGITVNSEGCAYVTGYTASTNFPTANPYQATSRGNYDVFVTKFTVDGNALVYSTYLGGTASDYGYGIAIDNSGCAYVTGYTGYNSSFPAVNAYQATCQGINDIFVTKFTAAGNALAYSTYLGGSSNDYGYGIAVNSAGCAYVTGYTASTNFPTANPYQATFNGNNDVVVTKLTAEGNALVYSTYLGGGGNDHGFGIAIDSAGCAYVTGWTASSNFPTANAYDSSYNTNTDGFVTKFTSAGSALAYSTYLGASYRDYAQGITVDSAGCAHVTGYTGSSDFPRVNPYQTTLKGSQDVFITKFAASGNALAYSTYLGGTGFDYGYGIAVDSAGCAYVTGHTNSSNFPTFNPYQGAKSENLDVLITKLTFCVVPIAEFSADATTGYAPLTVAFTDQSTSNPTSWSWDFGDGGTSDLQNPSHQYTTPGTYSVSLTATSACGNDTETKTGYITVNVCPIPVAHFTADPVEGCAPLEVTFTDQSTNNPTSWSWNFGDGGTSTLQNPTHEYTSPNTYTVTLTASNFCGSDSETTQIAVVPLSIDIISPHHGESFLTPQITVTGMLSCSGTEVTVNGISATVNGTNFTAENVPLAPGSNTITAFATYGGGSNAEDTISVILIVPQSPIHYFYDDLGRLIKAQDDEDNVIEYTYDSVGNRQTKTITIP